MNSSVTIRLPGFAIPDQNQQKNTQKEEVYECPAAPLAVEGGVSDEILLSQICEGSREALAMLFRRYARIVRGVVYRVLRDSSESDDLLQDVFLLIHRLCKTFDASRGPAKFWILQMAYRRAISRRRHLPSRHFYTHLALDCAASP